MDTLDHPAVTVAIDALAGADRDLTPVRVIVRDEIVAVLVDGERGRYVSFVRFEDEGWIAPGMIIGSPRPEGPRADRTPNHLPLQRKSTKLFTLPNPDGTRRDESWFAVTGLAARDAVHVSVTSELEERIAPIGSDGLAFAVVRARTSEDPRIYVQTCDGRRVPVEPFHA
ncbi:hypothetical protein IU450_26530 [Nocardia abscessus]|uniref:hypothetical protein n=1 Tax=Nocardia abscessus TaxID=120957 RepID=UPI0018946FD5|nr:hypothetical protein [Nocardia abscessus]MBF6339424.1 hypothetical protein [Nocardia abscessus]